MEGFENIPVDPLTLPKVVDQEFHSLSPGHKHSKYVNLILWGSVLLFVGIGAMFAFQVWDETSWIVWGIIGWTTFIGIRFYFITVGFRRKRYALRSQDLTYERGVLNFVVTSIPYNRVQHCEVSQGFVERLYEVASLKVYTAGGSSSDLSVPGLPPETAYELKDYILNQAHESESPQN